MLPSATTDFDTTRTVRRNAFGAMVFAGALVFASGAAAQSGTGLKLGEEAPEPTLDLGAGPSVDTAPAAPQPAAPQSGGGTATSGATAANAERVSFGDWEVACAPAGTDGGCAMAQIGNDATGTPVLEMVIRKLAEPLEVNDQTAVAILDVITPLGVVLTEGLGMQIDSGRNESAAFQICTEQGCLVREPVGDDLISRLKKGRIAKISVFAANQGEVTSDISLRGFTKAFEAVR